MRLAALVLASVLAAGCLGSPLSDDPWMLQATWGGPWDGGAIAVDGTRLAIVPRELGAVRIVDLASGDVDQPGWNWTGAASEALRWDGHLLRQAGIEVVLDWYAIPCGPDAPPGCHADGQKERGSVAVWRADVGTGLVGSQGHDVDLGTAGVAWHGADLYVLGGRTLNGSATSSVHVLRPGGSLDLIGSLPHPMQAPRVAWAGERAWLFEASDGSFSRDIAWFDVASGTSGERTAALPELDYRKATLASDGDRRAWLVGVDDGSGPHAILEIDLQGGDVRTLDGRLARHWSQATGVWADGALHVVVQVQASSGSVTQAWRLRD